ncbi:TPA: Bro-N domain-containing protein, partial [Clostridioides difficile]
MMNNLQIFKSEDFGQIRTVEIGRKLYFVATDIAKSLGYKDTTNAIKQHCKWVVKHHIPHPQSKTKTLEVNIIPEGDMYRLVSNSELQNAEKFESWIFDDVLPTIRQTGAYITNNANP